MREETERRISVCMCVCVCMLPPSCDRGYHCHSTFFVSEAQKKKKTVRPLACSFFFFSSLLLFFFHASKCVFRFRGLTLLAFQPWKRMCVFFFTLCWNAKLEKKKTKTNKKQDGEGKEKKKKNTKNDGDCDVATRVTCKCANVRAVKKDAMHTNHPHTQRDKKNERRSVPAEKKKSKHSLPCS